MKKIFDSAPLNLSVAMIIVGSSVLCGKVLSQEMPLFLASEIRFLLSTLLFLPFGIYSRRLFRLTSHDFLLLALMAFCGQVLFTVLLLLGLRYTSGISAGTLTSTTPFFMAIISFFLLHERFSKMQLFSLLFSFLSIFCLGYSSFLQLISSNADELIGDTLILCAVMGESLFLLLGKKLQADISGLNLTAILSLLGAVICLPPAILDAMHFDFFSLTGTDLLAMLYLGWIYTNLAYLCWFRGLKKSTGANAGIYTALMPLSAALFSLLWMKEFVQPCQCIALFFAISSIILSTLSQRVSKNEAKREHQLQAS